MTWWDTQLTEYEFLPRLRTLPRHLDRMTRRNGRDPADYPFWALTARSMQYCWGANVGLPLINEVANNIAGHRGVIINPAPRASSASTKAIAW